MHLYNANVNKGSQSRSWKNARQILPDLQFHLGPELQQFYEATMNYPRFWLKVIVCWSYPLCTEWFHDWKSHINLDVFWLRPSSSCFETCSEYQDWRLRLSWSFSGLFTERSRGWRSAQLLSTITERMLFSSKSNSISSPLWPLKVSKMTNECHNMFFT